MVPFEKLTDMLRRGAAAALPDLLPDWQTGAVKQGLVARLLALRAAHPQLFAEGSYEPVAVTGQHAGRVFAFRRSHGDTELIVLVPVQAKGLLGTSTMPSIPAEAWQETAISLPTNHHCFVSVLTGGNVTVSDAGEITIASVLRAFPVAVMLYSPSQSEAR
jgi:(1->4)-alpha-D-glucan 1-alpha-D-glucosylmutase